MAFVVTDKHLSAMAAVSGELTEIFEDARYWWLGSVAIEKSDVYAGHAFRSWPRWRYGFNHPVKEGMRLRAQEFTRLDGRPAIGVVLEDPTEGEDIYVGWVRAERSAEAHEWLSKLNAELERLFQLWAAAGKPGATSK